MTINEFIFSNKASRRYYRHVAFWLVFVLHFVIQNLMIGGPGEAKTSRTFGESFDNLLYFSPVYLLSTYLFTGLLIPVFLYKRKYFLFTLTGLLLLGLVATGCYWSGKLYIHNAWKIPYTNISFILNKYHTLVDGLFVPAMFWGIAGGFKMSKKWYEKQKENEQLARQKIATEIKLLKIQIHPRFLFHTLRSVQEHIHNLSNDAPAMVLQLSDLLSYLLYESDREQVLMEKEIEIVQSYINLQKNAEKNNHVTSIRVLGNAQNKTVTPLILFAFAENCFEYFFDKANTITYSLFLLTIKEQDTFIAFETGFKNSNYDPLLTEKKFKQMEQQLQSLYPLQNKIEISKQPGGFVIEWKIPILDINTNVQTDSILDEEEMAI